MEKCPYCLESVFSRAIHNSFCAVAFPEISPDELRAQEQEFAAPMKRLVEGALELDRLVAKSGRVKSKRRSMWTGHGR